MAELQYRNRSISQLVSELNHLGEPNVLLVPLRLTAIHEKDIPDVKRFKNSHGDQFFIPKNSQKKFPYNQIIQQVTPSQFAAMREHFQRGFNVSIIFSQPREQGRLTQLLSEIARIVGNCACSSVWFNEQSIYDSVMGSKLTERDIQNRLRYYRVGESNLIAFLDRMIRGQSKGSITLVKLRSMQSNTPSKNELNLICFPEEFFSPSLKSNDFLALCKSQLSQIFNYIKLNPANKYQHFSKLLTKRMPVTNALANLILQETASVVINWMSQGGPAVIHQRLAFYDKMRDLSVLLKKEEGFVPAVSQLPSNFHISRQERSNKSQEKFASKTDRTPIAAFDEESQLDYCRSLQRKTHKYSINDIQLFDVKNQSPPEEESSDFRVTSNTPSPVTHLPSFDKQTSREREKNTSRENQVKKFDETMPRRQNPDSIRESEQVAILKANHAIQISQYHQTIQQLNRKVLALMKQKDLEELYTIHEREIMLLELKIKELRNDITVLSNSPEDKSYKAMVRKLNEEIKRLESKSSEQKVANGKTAVLEKQLAEIRRKYEESETARKKLTFELEHLTKRLKICDMQIAQMNNQQIDLKTIPKTTADSGSASPLLSIKDDQALKQIQILLKSIQQGNQQSKGYLLRKITNILTDLSSSRNIILQCNDFLVQLEEHLQEKLGNKEPQIVLDCNRFIRNFLMDNLNIF